MAVAKSPTLQMGKSDYHPLGLCSLLPSLLETSGICELIGIGLVKHPKMSRHKSHVNAKLHSPQALPSALKCCFHSPHGPVGGVL